MVKLVPENLRATAFPKTPAKAETAGQQTDETPPKQTEPAASSGSREQEKAGENGDSLFEQAFPTDGAGARDREVGEPEEAGDAADFEEADEADDEEDDEATDAADDEEDEEPPPALKRKPAAAKAPRQPAAAAAKPAAAKAPAQPAAAAAKPAAAKAATAKPTAAKAAAAKPLTVRQAGRLRASQEESDEPAAKQPKTAN